MRECRLFGVDPVALGHDAEQDSPTTVWPDMVDSVGLFFALSTQWNWIGAGMAGAFRSGLKYEVIKPVAAMLKIRASPTIFADLRTMEAAAIEAWGGR